MSSNPPKRQHYVPQFLLRNFCDSEGFFWVGDTEKGTVRKTKPGSNFVINDLYTEHVFDPDTGDLIRKDYRHDKAIGKLESAAGLIVKEIIEKARDKKCPELSEKDSKTFKRFVLSMARRTPESQRRVMLSESFKNIFYVAAKERADQLDYPLPDKNTLFQDPQIVELMQKVQRNVDARFAAGDDSRLIQDEEEFCRETGLWVGVIGVPKRSFVIGSHGTTIFKMRGHEQSCLPIAHDVVVLVSPNPDREILETLTREKDWLIRKINMAASSRSRWIAGHSEQLILSLV